jgi:hypothetical protein
MTDDDSAMGGPDEEFPAATERPGPKDEDTTEKCAADREELEPHATADCAGGDLVKQYDNEEDGGS